ncbi:MAG: SufD family Fe-S cluster assembly protein, partial [Gammaproteobacteria bacterium]
DAQKTKAHMTNKNLLLAKTGEIDTKPELQIDADDVQCSHGATVGQLSEEALFYLRSRGIEEADAKKILTSAFAKEIIDKIKIESFRREVENAI